MIVKKIKSECERDLKDEKYPGRIGTIKKH